MIVIAVGSNLSHPDIGAPKQVCQAALDRVAAAGIVVRRRSSWYRSAPVPASVQPWFVNAVAEVAVPAGMDPGALLSLLHRVEDELGRARKRPNEARVVDLDLIDFEGRVTPSDAWPLLPHPRLHERGFVLVPLRELAADWRHPVSGAGLDSLIAALASEQVTERLA
jgi:2-amino-4-hydroxy-6-hydroxymethyldihydropteridine diphosphokinase